MKDIEKFNEIKEHAIERHIPIIMDDTLKVIEERLRARRTNRILEIGTAVGYSAICFSEFLEPSGIIDTIERDEERIKEAKEKLKEYKMELEVNNLEENQEIDETQTIIKEQLPKPGIVVKNTNKIYVEI